MLDDERLKGKNVFGADYFDDLLDRIERFDFLSVFTIRRLRRIPFIEVRIIDEAGEPIAVMTSSGYRKDVELLFP